MIKIKLINTREEVLNVSIDKLRIMHDVRGEDSFLTELVCEGSSDAIKAMHLFIDIDDDRDKIRLYATHFDHHNDSNVDLLSRSGIVDSLILSDSNNTCMIITKRKNFIGGPGADQIDP